MISVDTLRADYLSCYGTSPVRTPNIDRIAEDGVLFEKVQTVAPTTLPSHASMFTGVRPTRHGVRDNVGFYLPEGIPTLATVLAEAGYRTGGFVGGFVLDSRFGIGQGFDTYYDDFDSLEEDVAGGFVSQRRGEAVLGESLSWIEGKRGQPFFAFIHFYDPHTPYDPPAPFIPDERTNAALYGGEVAYVDSLVGRLLGFLDDRELAQSTLIVLTSDHGEALGEHGELTHGFFVYEPTLRIPLVVRYPGVDEGRRVSDLVRIVDIPSTILDLLDVPIPEGLDGQSLRPLLEGSERDLGLTAYGESYLPRLHYGWSELRSLRKGPYKLILAPRPELYNIDEDPAETRNRFAEEPEIAARLQEELVEILNAPGAEIPAASGVDPETLATLHALGYVGGFDVVTTKPFTDLADPKDRISIYERVNDPSLSAVEPQHGQRFEQALLSLRAAIDEDPSIPRAHILYGELLFKAGRAKDASDAFSKALEHQPKSYAATYGLALSQLDLGEVDEAERYFRLAIELEPENTKSYLRLAELERKRGDLEASERWLRQALEIHPDRILQERLAEILLESGRSSEAEIIFSAMSKRYGEDAITLYNMGQSLLAQGDHAEALNYLERAAEQDPSDSDTANALGNALAASGNLDGAIAEFRRAVDLSPCAAGAHSNLGTAYLQIGRADEALEAWEKAIACNPQYRIAYTNSASVLLQLGLVDRAVEVLRQAVERIPDDPELERFLKEIENQRSSIR